MKQENFFSMSFKILLIWSNIRNNYNYSNEDEFKDLFWIVPRH